MPITYLDEEKPKSKITYLDEGILEAPKKPLSYTEKREQLGKEEFKRKLESRNPLERFAAKSVRYLTPQALSQAEFEPGQKNILGDIQHALSRPGGAVRSAIMPKDRNRFLAALSGFQKPEEAPTFQEEVYRKFAPKLTGNQAVDYAKAFPSVFAGTALDVATDPITYAGGIAARFLGKTAKGQVITKGIGKEFGKAGKIIKTTAKEIAESPIGETAKRGFVKAIENIKSLGNKVPKIMNREWILEQPRRALEVADDTVKGIQEEYRYLYDDIGIGKMEVNKTELKDVIYSLFKGATKEEADDIINTLKTGIHPLEGGPSELSATLDTVQKVKNILQKDIPESVWMRGKKGFNLTPVQVRKVKAYFKLKNITEKTLAGTEEGEYLKYLDKKATDTYRLTKVIKRMVIDQTGEPQETGRLLSAFGGKAQQAGKENLFYRLKELNEDTQRIITNMNKFRKRQELKMIGKKVIGRTAIGYGIYELVNRLTR
ncbi:MAG: hypothetical protein QME16_00075 [Planctomycetota bacterium]|nr:hypothetical protein [Planctomycetota bacterium]